MTFRYEIDESNTVRAWDLTPREDGTEDIPFLLQPHNPANGLAWESKEEAETWITEVIHNLENPPVVEPTEPTEEIAPTVE